MAAAELATVVGIVAACAALAVSRASWYRLHRPVPKPPATPRPSPPRALDASERQEVLDVLHSERFVDRAPAEVVATLLDEERYLCSERTRYRVMGANKEGRERRNQLRHPEYKKPELLATGPNQVWSWDITKLRGPVKWPWFYLYAIIDIFSRYVVGWMVAERENAAHARRLIAQTCEKHGVADSDLILHSDRGVPMTAKTTVASRHGRQPLPEPASRLRRQPVLRSAIQNREVPPQLPRALRRHRRRHRVLPIALPLERHRASPLRDRHAHARGRPLRPSRRGAGAPTRSPRGRLPPSPGALRPSAASAAIVAHRSLDQPAAEPAPE